MAEWNDPDLAARMAAGKIRKDRPKTYAKRAATNSELKRDRLEKNALGMRLKYWQNIRKRKKPKE